jgi:hypothetical protein
VIQARSIRSPAPHLRSLSIVAVALLTVVVACSSDDDDGAAATAPPEPAANDTSAATDEPAADPATGGEDDGAPASGDAAAFDFGSGSGSITLGDETFELAIGPGTGICRDVFGIIQASGTVTDGRDVEGEFAIPPLDWETYTDGRYDPPSVALEITSTGDDNASWRADAAWAEENGKAGMSQVDSYEKDGLSASGTATFANNWNTEAESVQGSFEISCAEA